MTTLQLPRHGWWLTMGDKRMGESDVGAQQQHILSQFVQARGVGYIVADGLARMTQNVERKTGTVRQSKVMRLHQWRGANVETAVYYHHTLMGFVCAAGYIGLYTIDGNERYTPGGFKPGEGRLMNPDNSQDVDDLLYEVGKWSDAGITKLYPDMGTLNGTPAEDAAMAALCDRLRPLLLERGIVLGQEIFGQSTTCSTCSPFVWVRDRAKYAPVPPRAGSRWVICNDGDQLTTPEQERRLYDAGYSLLAMRPEQLERVRGMG